jgi:hypothetical protein
LWGFQATPVTKYEQAYGGGIWTVVNSTGPLAVKGDPARGESPPFAAMLKPTIWFDLGRVTYKKLSFVTVMSPGVSESCIGEETWVSAPLVAMLKAEMERSDRFVE